MSKNYYATLGVEKTASDADIKKAFRELAHKYHPDKESGDETKFKEINEAYQVLGNKEKRAQYDQFGSTFTGAGPGSAEGFQWQNFYSSGGNPFGGGGGQQVNFDFGDLGDILGDMFGFGSAQRRPRRGRHVEAVVPVSFIEAYTGTEKEVSVTIEGKSKKLKVSIPAGISAEQTLRISGKGEPAPEADGIPGDLFVRVTVEPHPEFKREGYDIYSREEVPLSTLINGDSVEVKTPTGKAKIKVPSGTVSGKRFVLKGKGFERLTRGRGRGDLYVAIHAYVPDKLTVKQRKLLDEFEQTISHKSRQKKNGWW